MLLSRNRLPEGLLLLVVQEHEWAWQWVGEQGKPPVVGGVRVSLEVDGGLARERK